MVVRRRGGGGKLGLMLLAAQIMNFGIENIAPVTLALIGGQVAIFLDVFPKYFPSASGVCMSSYLVYHHEDWRRMLLATFYHAHDMHLYFNMVSLIYKGNFLERRFGSLYFAYMVAVFSALTSTAYVGLGFACGELLNDHSYITSCAVGFSGVLFAMKVLTTEYSPPGTSYALGFIPIPSKYIYWAELGLIQLITPNASFIGHLAGILVGIAYTRGPLKFIMDIFLTPEQRDDGSIPNRSGRQEWRRGNGFPFASRLFTRGPQDDRPRTPPRHFYGSGRPMPSAPTDEERMPNEYYGGQGYERYTGGMDEDEQYQRAMEESLSESSRQNTRPSNSSPRLYPNLDDLRSRRARFYEQ